MTVQQFITNFNNRAADFDGWYGAQCVDLIQFFNRDVVGGARFSGNAVNIWDQPGDKYVRILNSPSFVPQAGDIVVWNRRYGNGYGHVGIATGTGNTTWFESLDQNWSRPAATIVRHNYDGVIGVLRPKILVRRDVTTLQPSPYHTHEVIVPNLQVRTGAGTQYQGGQASTPDGMLHLGMVASCTGHHAGQWINLNGKVTNLWGRSARGNYYSLAGVR